MDLIVKMKFGSHLYGTDTKKSDMDYKGIFLPSKKEILLNYIPKCRNFSTGDDFSKNNPGDLDEEIYSLNYFIKLACDGQTAAMDMIHAPDEMLIKSSDIWKEIVKNKDKFYSKNISSFVNYARRQASKYGIKGSRLNTAQTLLTILNESHSDLKLRDIWNKLPRDENAFDLLEDPNGMKQYQICGKTFQESSSIGYVIPIMEKFYNEYGHRAKLAAQNKNIDWKAVSHAIRAAIQIKEILTSGTIKFPLKDAPFILKVKKGELDYLKEVAPALESLMNEVEEKMKKSNLPENVDKDYWDNFLCETLEKERFKK